MPQIIAVCSVLALTILVLWWVARPKRAKPTAPIERQLPSLTSPARTAPRPASPPRTPLLPPLPSKAPPEPEYLPYVPPPRSPPQKPFTNEDLARARASIAIQSEPEKAWNPPKKEWKAPRVVASPPIPVPLPRDAHQPYVPPSYVPQPKLTGKDLRRARTSIARSTTEAPRPVASLPKVALALVPPPAPRSLTAAAPIRSFSELHPFAGTKFQLTYSDENGEVTERKIKLIRVEEGRDTIRLVAYCYRRKDQRSFRADRIISIADIETGTEIVNPERFFSV